MKIKLIIIAFTTSVAVSGCQMFADKLPSESASKVIYTSVPTMCILSMDKASEAMENVAKALSYPVNISAYTKACKDFKVYSKEVTQECPLSEEDFELWESTYDGLDCNEQVINNRS